MNAEPKTHTRDQSVRRSPLSLDMVPKLATFIQLIFPNLPDILKVLRMNLSFSDSRSIIKSLHFVGKLGISQSAFFGESLINALLLSNVLGMSAFF